MGSLNIYNKKNSKGKNIVIVILIITIIALLCISYLEVEDVKKESKEYQKQIEKLKNTKTEQPKKEIETGTMKALVNFLNKNQTRKLISVIGNDKQIDFTTQKVDNNILYAALLINNMFQSGDTTILNNYFKQYGMTNIPYQNIICTVDNKPIYLYNSAKHTYTFTGIHNHEIPISFTEPIYIKPISLKEDKESYTLIVNEVYADPVKISYISADPEGKVKIDDYTNYQTEAGAIDTTKIIENFENNYKENNYPKYKYTFKKDEKGSYYLTQYEKVNQS